MGIPGEALYVAVATVLTSIPSSMAFDVCPTTSDMLVPSKSTSQAPDSAMRMFTRSIRDCSSMVLAALVLHSGLTVRVHTLREEAELFFVSGSQFFCVEL